MFESLRKALFNKTAGIARQQAPSSRVAPPAGVTEGPHTFDLQPALQWHEELPHLDWQAVRTWVESLPDASRHDPAWAACEAAWLEHLAQALGAGFEVYAAADTQLVARSTASEAKRTMQFIVSTRRDVLNVLADLAQDEGWGRHIVVLFDDQDSYYRYVSRFYPTAGEFGLSGGMFINAGCAHFVAVEAELQMLQPVIAHETTHAMLAHLPLPAWLNEGLAVNTEQRLCPVLANPSLARLTPQQMHRRHVAFWGADDVQAFWSGQSFLRSDEGNELSYDLARILVAQFSKDWPAFTAFANAAKLDDAGAAAAQEHLGIDLGAAIAAILEKQEGAHLAPDPSRWTAAPEKGGFCPLRLQRD
jgi:hypothetical protein